jgi:adenylate cyclase
LPPGGAEVEIAVLFSDVRGSTSLGEQLGPAEALIRAIGYREGSEPLLPVGVSIHAGPAYVGKIGSSGITDFTALGDTVNTAARLQGIAGAGEVLLSEVLFQAVAEHYPQLEQRVVTIRGKEEPFAIRVLHCGAR